MSPTRLKKIAALSLLPTRACRSPMVFRTVRSLGSSLTTFSYSLMAFCSLPCCTAFSAAARTFCLLNPKPSAIWGPSTACRSYLKFISALAGRPDKLLLERRPGAAVQRRTREHSAGIRPLAGTRTWEVAVKYHNYRDFSQQLCGWRDRPRPRLRALGGAGL